MMSKKRKLKVIELLKSGKADLNTQLEAAEMLEDREYNDTQQRRDFYTFCLALSFLCVLVVVMASIFN